MQWNYYHLRSKNLKNSNHLLKKYYNIYQNYKEDVCLKACTQLLKFKFKLWRGARGVTEGQKLSADFLSYFASENRG